MRLLILALFPLLLTANEELLSSLKKKSIELEYRQNKEVASKTKTEWVKPIIGTYRYDNNDYYSPNQESSGATLLLSQPIFQSGGIYYQLKLGDLKGEMLDIATDIRKQGLLKELLQTLYRLKKSDIEIEKQKLLIKNARIDLQRKVEQFEAGFLDAGFLDNAMIEKNREELRLLELEDAKADLEALFNNLSDLEYKSIDAPYFKEIDQESFLNANNAVKLASFATLESKYNRNKVISSYLPEVKIEGSYNFEKISGGTPYGLRGANSWEDYRRIGFSVSMPIFDINIKNNIQVASIEHLKRSVEAEDKKRSESNLYKEVGASLKTLDKKIELTNEDIKSYVSLLLSTKESLKAGEKTSHDVETLENSQEIRRLDIKLYELDRQIALLNLYEKMGK